MNNRQPKVRLARIGFFSRLVPVIAFVICGAELRAAEPATAAEKATIKDQARWGDWSGRIVCDCEKPLVPEEITITKDQETCGDSMQSERLLVNPKDGGLANVFVYLVVQADAPGYRVHPDYEKTAQDKVVLAVSKGRFVPHCIMVRTTQTISLKFLDPIGHNARIIGFTNAEFCATIPARGDREEKLKLPETMPIRAQCEIHPWMSAWVLVRDNPYMALTDESGRFEIRNLPVGEWTFRLWHEKSGWIGEGKIGGDTLAWPKGRFIAKIAAGKNDLGELHVKPKLFEDKR